MSTNDSLTRQTMQSALWLLLFALLMPSASASSVWVVATSGPSNFTNLKSAIEAAASGDTLLVRSSSPFAQAVVVGKSLTIVGDGTVPTINGTLFIRDLSPEQFVIVRGLSFKGTAFANTAILVRDNQGSVLLEEVDSVNTNIGHGLWAQLNPGHLSLVRCNFSGGVTPSNGLPGQGATWLTMAWVSAYECNFTGGQGAASQSGGLGIVCDLNGVLLSGCNVTGGDNGAGYTGLTAAAFLAKPGTGMVRDQATIFSNGAGGPGGPPFVTSPGTTVVSPSSSPRSLNSSTAVREGQSGSLTYSGEVGDQLGFFADFIPAGIPLAVEKGIYHLGGPAQVLLATGTALDGSFSLPFVAPSMPSGLDAVTLVIQALAIDGSGLRLSNPSAVTLLSASY